MTRFIRFCGMASALLFSFVANAFEGGQTVRLSALDRTASVKNSSLSSGESVHLWTETNTNSQRWILEEGSNGMFYLKSSYTGYYLSCYATSNNSNIVQSTKVSTRSQWDIVPVEGQADTYIIYLGSTHKFCLAAPTSSSDGAGMTLITASTAPESRSHWKVYASESTPTGLTPAMRNDIMNKWRDHYYHKASTGYVIGKGGWWGDAEMFEVVLDAYETTGDRQYITMFDNLYKNFCQRNNTDWSGNNFNDDIAWMCIACIRAYLMTGNTDYRDKAKSNYDKMLTRADKYGDGTLIWCQNWEGGGPAGTNSCINGPAAVCACYLGIATGTESYFTKAKKIYTGEREKLMEKNSDGSLTGKVWDSYNQKEGKVGNYWASSYNQGTNLGAAMMLYNHYGDEQYKKDADAIMKWTYNNMKDGHGVMTACQNVTGDLAGFKAILMRYVRRYAAEHNAPQYYTWLAKTAYHAWNNRNSKGVTSGGWLTKTEENFKRGEDSYDTDGVGAMGIVSAAFNAHLGVVDNHPAYERIEVETFNFINNANVMEDVESGAFIAGPLKGKNQLGYRNVQFGNRTATHLTIRMKALRSDAKITFYADQPSSTKGTTICALTKDDITSTGEWVTIEKELAQPITGQHDIYMVVANTSTSYEYANVDWFQFDSRSTIYNDVTKLGGELTSSMISASLDALVDGQAVTGATFITNADAEKWIQYVSPAPVRLDAYSLWSGLTASTHPTKLQLLASNDGVEWQTIDQVDTLIYTTCGQSFTKKVDVAQTYTHFRFLFPTTAKATSVTLSELQLMGTAIAPLDLTADGGTIDEAMKNLTDKDVQTIVDVPARAVYSSQGNYRLSSYSVTGVAENDTLSWKLEGSENGSSWKALDEQANVVVPFAQNTMCFALQNTLPYSYYRITFSGKPAQVAQWQLFGALDFGTYYADAAETCDVAGALNAQALLDNDGTTVSDLEGSSPTLEILTPLPFKPVGYSIVPGDDAQLDPQDVRIVGIDDATDEQLVLAEHELNFPIRGQRKASTLSSTKTFTRFLMQFNTQDGASAAVRLADVELYASAIAEEESDMYHRPSSFTSNISGTSTTYSIDKANDMKYSTMYQAKFTEPVTISITYDKPYAFEQYAISASKSSAACDPATWTLQGSQDGVKWATLDTRADEIFSHRYATQFYPVNSNGNEYQFYRLTIDAVNGGANLQLGQVQLLSPSLSPTVVEQFQSAAQAQMIAVYGGLQITSPEATVVRFYDAQGALLAVQPVGVGVTQVALPKAGGMVIAVMNVDGKPVMKKIMSLRK